MGGELPAGLCLAIIMPLLLDAIDKRERTARVTLVAADFMLAAAGFAYATTRFALATPHLALAAAIFAFAHAGFAR